MTETSAIYKERVNLDDLEPITESKALFDLLRTFHYVQNGNGYGNNIAIAIAHPDTKVNLVSANRMTIEFGSNLTSIALQTLIDFCKKANWWFVVNRCSHDRVEVDFRENF